MLAKITVGFHCRGRFCSCGCCGWVPAPRWLWMVLGFMFSCLRSSCKCLRFLPFWHPVKDTRWMRDQALNLQIAAWSTECIDSSFLLWLMAIFVTIFLSLSDVACSRLWRTALTILPFLCCFLLSSFTGQVGHPLLSTSKKWTYSLYMQSIHHFN